MVKVLLTATLELLSSSVTEPVKLKSEASDGASSIEAVMLAARPVFVISRIAPCAMCTVTNVLVPSPSARLTSLTATPITAVAPVPLFSNVKLPVSRWPKTSR